MSIRSIVTEEYFFIEKYVIIYYTACNKSLSLRYKQMFISCMTCDHYCIATFIP